MKTFLTPLPANNPATGAGDHVGDHQKIRDSLVELRASVPNAPSEVGAAPSTILNGSGKVTDVALASIFIKSINGTTPDSNGNVVVSSSGYDGSDTVKLTGNQSVAGIKSFSTAPTSATDGTDSTALVRKSQLDTKADSSSVVNLTTAQSVAGIKTFLSPPVSSSAASSANQLVRKNELDLKADVSSLSAKANGTDVVYLANDQTVNGVKTFVRLPVAASTATADSQLINFGQVKSLIPGLGTPATLLASQNWTGLANGTEPSYGENVIPNGNATGASVTVQSEELRVTSPSSSGEVNRKFWYSDTPNADADITVTFRWDGTGTNVNLWFVYRTSNSGTSITRGSGTMAQLNFGANELNFGRAGTSGVYTPYSTYAGPKTLGISANVKYKIRTLLVGQRVRFKLWPALSAEPSSWNFDITDPTDFAGAPANVGFQVQSDTQTNFYIDDLSYYTPATGISYVQTVNGLTPDTNGNVAINATMLTRTPTASTTLVITDANGAVDYNSSSAGNVTVALDTTTNFPTGTVIEISQLGTGQVTLVPASGVTLRTSSTLKTRVQYSVIALRKLANNTWLVSGDLA